MDAFRQDLRFALRQFLATPAASLVAVLSLALAIGASTVVFGLADAVVLRPLPYPEPERLVTLWQAETESGAPPRVGVRPPTVTGLSVPNFADLRDGNEVFEGVAGYFRWSATLAGDPLPEKFETALLSHDGFALLGAAPILGRGFAPEDCRPGADVLAVLGHGLWQSRFGGDPEVLGRTLRLDGREYTVVGVMPPGFSFPDQTQIWVPNGLSTDLPRSFGFVRTFGRLEPGVTLERAQQELDAIAGRLREQYPDDIKDRYFWLDPLENQILGAVRPKLLMLLGAVGFLLLIACGNVASLLLARMAARRSEIAVRMAQGASRGRLMRQLLTESLLLGVAGGGLGAALAGWGIGGVRTFLEGSVPRVDQVTLDLRVLGFALAVTLATALLFGLAPALRASRLPLGQTLGAGRRSVSAGSGQRLERAVVTIQVAVALTLLIGAGLMLKSFDRLLRVDPGFAPERVLLLDVSLVPFEKYAETAITAEFYRRLMERVESLPGVESAGAIWAAPLSGRKGVVPLKIDDRPPPPGQDGEPVSVQAATPGFFDTLGVRRVRGRLFTDRDDASAPQVVVVNETLARQFFGDRDPVGERVTFGVGFGPAGGYELGSREIVGVVGDVRRVGLAEAPPPELYFPVYQSNWRWLTLAIRTATSEPAGLVASVRHEVRRLDADLGVDNVRTMEHALSRSVAEPTLLMALLSFFGGLALVLAGLGVYGVSAYATERKTREIGLRMALGGRRIDVLWLIMRRGLVLGIAGVALGLAAALGLTRFLRGALYEVESLDPAVFALVAAVLVAVLLLASWLPARRAARIDPGQALREEA